MSIYATLWHIRIRRDGIYALSEDEWVDIWAQAVPPHIGHPSHYPDGDPYGDFLPPVVDYHEEAEEYVNRASCLETLVTGGRGGASYPWLPRTRGAAMARRDVAACLAELRPRYQAASRAQKSAMLTRVCEVTGYHRKAAIRLLGTTAAAHRRTGRRPGRPQQYDGAVRRAAVQVWEASGRLASKNLVDERPTLLAQRERHGELTLEPATRAALLGVSAATLDRLLRPQRQALGRRRWAGAAASALRAQVLVRTFSEWRDVAPGSQQADLVLHCGASTRGHYLTTLVSVDVATSWCALQAVWGKTSDRVGAALWRTRAALPFPLRELHTDNGSEFLNDGLVRWCRTEGIRYTRGRPYNKNDQAWGEQKNWVAVRKLIGYDRYSSRAASAQLGRVLPLIADYLNVCQPVRRVVATERVGARVRKRYDTAQTPYQRLLAAGVLTPEQAIGATALAEAINPVALRARLERELERLWALADPPAAPFAR